LRARGSEQLSNAARLRAHTERIHTLYLITSTPAGSCVLIWSISSASSYFFHCESPPYLSQSRNSPKIVFSHFSCGFWQIFGEEPCDFATPRTSGALFACSYVLQWLIDLDRHVFGLRRPACESGEQQCCDNLWPNFPPCHSYLGFSLRQHRNSMRESSGNCLTVCRCGMRAGGGEKCPPAVLTREPHLVVRRGIPSLSRCVTFVYYEMKMQETERGAECVTGGPLWALFLPTVPSACCFRTPPWARAMAPLSAAGSRPHDGMPPILRRNRSPSSL